MRDGLMEPPARGLPSAFELEAQTASLAGSSALQGAGRRPEGCAPSSQALPEVQVRSMWALRRGPGQAAALLQAGWQEARPGCAGRAAEVGGRGLLPKKLGDGRSAVCGLSPCRRPGQVQVLVRSSSQCCQCVWDANVALALAQQPGTLEHEIQNVRKLRRWAALSRAAHPACYRHFPL